MCAHLSLWKLSNLFCNFDFIHASHHELMEQMKLREQLAFILWPTMIPLGKCGIIIGVHGISFKFNLFYGTFLKFMLSFWALTENGIELVKKIWLHMVYLGYRLNGISYSKLYSVAHTMPQYDFRILLFQPGKHAWMFFKHYQGTIWTCTY